MNAGSVVKKTGGALKQNPCRCVISRCVMPVTPKACQRPYVYGSQLMQSGDIFLSQFFGENNLVTSN